jgi:hypothetical protein
MRAIHLVAGQGGWVDEAGQQPRRLAEVPAPEAWAISGNPKTGLGRTTTVSTSRGDLCDLCRS